MKPWIKITLGIQAVLIIFFFVLAKIQAAEAEKQYVAALVQSQLAQQNAERAEMEAARSEQMAVEARRAQNDAEEMRLVVIETTAELLKCSSKK